MTVPSNTFQTYQAIGNREDLSDVIYRIDPTDTPCMTAFEREKAIRGQSQWQTQALAAVDTANAVVEGDDATSDAATPFGPARKPCHISDKVARVSVTQRAVEHAGRDDELEYQETLKGLELKRDMESFSSAATRPRPPVMGPSSHARQPRSSPGSGPTPTRAPPAAQPILRRRMAPAPAPTAPSAPSPRRS